MIPGARASDKVDLVAVASRDRARAEAYSREWVIPRAYGSYDELLADPEIEAVYISLPNSLHCEWSVRAVEAGKHVLCEKPMSRRAARVAGFPKVAQSSLVALGFAGLSVLRRSTPSLPCDFGGNRRQLVSRRFGLLRWFRGLRRIRQACTGCGCDQCPCPDCTKK